MVVRNVEWKLPYTWGKAITVNPNTKVISLNLRDENNLIIYDSWDNEIYVDLQLPDWILPNYAFPVWITTGRVLVADGWDVTGTIIVARTTSWDIIKLVYWDNWKLFIDNWSGLFKQIYLAPEVDALLATKQDVLIAWENISIAADGRTISATMPAMSRFLSLWDCATGEPISFPGNIPFEYRTWDHYLVTNVSSATPAVNYRPSWNAYDGSASTTVESNEVQVWDEYIYDGTIWLLQRNNDKVVDFANIAWQPSDNTNLATALNAKQDSLVSGTNIKTINSNSVLWSWDLSLNEVPSGGTTWQVLKKTASGYWWDNESWAVTSVNGYTWVVNLNADDISDSTTTNKFVTATEKNTWNGKQDALVNQTNIKSINWTSLLGSWDLAINDIYVWSSAPSNPTVGTAWYDWVNGVLKMYNWVNWIEQLQNLVILQYGSSTWADFTAAYSKNAIVYCLASSNSSNPGTGTMTRLAFMAYVNSASNPSEVQFQYYRSTATKSKTSHVDEVYAYTLKPTSWGTWTFDVRKTGPTVLAWTWISTSWSSATSSLTINNSLPFNPSNSGTTGQVIKKTAGGYEWANESGWGGGWIQLAANSPINLAYIWAGYEDDYANISAYDATTAYLVIEWNNPWGWWQPGTNTLAYFPYTTNATEQIWNITYVQWTQPTIGSYTSAGVACAEFTSSTSPTYHGGLTLPTIFTVSAWVYNTGFYQYDGKIVDFSYGSVTTSVPMRAVLMYAGSFNGTGEINGGSSSMTTSSVSQNAWHHVVWVWNSSTGNQTIYVDWVQAATNSCTSLWTWDASLTIGNQFWDEIPRHFVGYMSQLIIESWEWSATNVLNYYTATKSNYGIN